MNEIKEIHGIWFGTKEELDVIQERGEKREDILYICEAPDFNAGGVGLI